MMREVGHSSSALRVLYHGTQQVFSQFQVSPRGTLGRGIYFTSTLEQANMFGGEDANTLIMSVHLLLTRPYFYTVREPEEVDLWGGADPRHFRPGPERRLA